MRSDLYSELTQHLGVDVDPNLLALAFTHRSFAYESGAKETNERLEFLGDSVLGLIVTEELFLRFPDLDESRLSPLRSGVVNMRALADIARELNLGKYIRLGKGEEVTGGRDKNSLLADALEALIGAIYLDGGIEAAREIVVAWFKSFLDSALQTQPVKDAKTALQEWLQHRNKPLPDYQLIGTGGEAHSRLFTVSCQISAVETTMTATATSRRRAEQMVAEQLLEEVEKSK